MKQIGVISDTHSFIDEKVLDFLKNSDYIFHAGDIGSEEIIKKLRKIAKLYAVHGNIDNNMIKQIVSETEFVEIEGVKFLMTHIGGYPGRYTKDFYKKIVSLKPDVVICGHSHILKVIYDKNLNHLHINSGAYGKNGFHKKRTAIRFAIENKQIKDLEIYEVNR